MSKRAGTLASNHHTLRVGPADLHGASFNLVEAAPVLVRMMERCLKKQLFAAGDERTGLEITLAGLRPIQLVTKRFGHTALVGGVLRAPQSFVECLSVCRAGIDDDEDEAALTAAANLILQDGTHEFVAALLDQVRGHPRPHAVHIHFDEDNYDDPAARIVTHCLAESFFDQFGLEKPYEASDI
jgi:hypothetical protein